MQKFKIGDKVVLGKFSAKDSAEIGFEPEMSKLLGTTQVITSYKKEWRAYEIRGWTWPEASLTAAEATEKSVTAWAVEVDGQIGTKVFSSRELARTRAAHYRKVFPSKKVVVRKVKIEIVKGR